MAVRSDKHLSQSYIVERAKKVLELSEQKLIDILEGKTKLPERVVAQVALELYKRRIPTVAEGSGGTNNLTVIKIVKNHLPDSSGEIVDINACSQALETAVEKKLRVINERIKKKAEEFYANPRTEEEPSETR